jgi:erythronate-4-phosphate dehydrogenase
MIKIVADHKIPFLKGALDSCAHLVYLPGRDISATAVKDAHAMIIRTRTTCNKALLNGSAVKCIASATIGYDHIDAAYCEEQNIFWTNAPGCNASSVKQYVASALAFIITQTGKTFRELTIGIVGAGHVGSRVQAMTSSLGMATVVNDPPRARREGGQGFASIEEVLGRSDIITMHVPLHKQGADKTLHMADEAFFAASRKDSWFINSSRGEVAKTSALLTAIEQGHLGGAILDVWEHEPRISASLLRHAAIATPHIAGYSADGKANGTTMSVQAVSKYFGLKLDDWSPASIPPPREAEPVIDCTGLGAEDLFCKLAMHTYNIVADSVALKESVATFEQQREEYPVRREPEAYSLTLVNPQSIHKTVAGALGFG